MFNLRWRVLALAATLSSLVLAGVSLVHPALLLAQGKSRRHGVWTHAKTALCRS